MLGRSSQWPGFTLSGGGLEGHPAQPFHILHVAFFVFNRPWHFYPLFVHFDMILIWLKHGRWNMLAYLWSVSLTVVLVQRLLPCPALFMLMFAMDLFVVESKRVTYKCQGSAPVPSFLNQSASYPRFTYCGCRLPLRTHLPPFYF